MIIYNYLYWTENHIPTSNNALEARRTVKAFRDFEFSFQQIEQWQQEAFAVQFESKLNHPPIELPPNPKSVDEALSGKYRDLWIEAIEKELAQFDDRKIFSPAPSNGRAMKSKIILIYKYNNDYSIKCKARLVACGYSQIKGLDYNEVFAPTTETSTAYLLMTEAASSEMFIALADFEAAFLEGNQDVNTKMYAILPKELFSDDAPVQRREIRKNWYGTKQAAKVWNDKLNDILVNHMGMSRNPVQPCHYVKSLDTINFIKLVAHVDDLFIISNKSEHIEEFAEEIRKYVKKVVFSVDFKRYLGMDYKQLSDGSIMMSQETYIRKQNWKPSSNKVTLTPMQVGTNLKTAISNPKNDSILSPIGILRSLADKSRLDLLVTAGELSSKPYNPTGEKDCRPSDLHLKVIQRTKDYLLQFPSEGLIFRKGNGFRFFGYCDGSYRCDGDSKSRLGGAIFPNEFSAAVMAWSTNDTSFTTISHSVMEVEIKGIDLMILKLVHLIEVAKFNGIEINDPIPIFCDNMIAVELCNTLKSTHKSKVINMRINYIREMINQRFVKIIFISSNLNVSDVLTKPLSSDMHLKHCHTLMNGHDGYHPLDHIKNYRALVHVTEESYVLTDFEASDHQTTCSNEMEE